MLFFYVFDMVAAALKSFFGLCAYAKARSQDFIVEPLP